MNDHSLIKTPYSIKTIDFNKKPFYTKCIGKKYRNVGIIFIFHIHINLLGSIELSCCEIYFV